ncbi:MAG: 2-C-methyl-D-erythritol 4-phosphate cytidylyltransferase [Bacteroidota bacterium]|nr:2-C-methyl-D-erythritol 4-phosphate cytidylyltransferase [Bacteroidota bacterium]
MDEYVVIVAGGNGTRMGTQLPKQFIVLNGLPVLMHTILQFYRYNINIKIIVVLPAIQIEFWKELCVKHNFSVAHEIVTGGNSRFHSVKNGLNSILYSNALVAIHDGVRPFVPISVIEDSFESASKYGSGVVAVALKDSIRKKISNENSTALNRNDYVLMQTPQTFNLMQIKSAFQVSENPSFTDDATVFEASGYTIKLVEGDYKNIKITTPEDLIIAQAFINAQK